jgi:hypothetical protein
LFLPPASWTFRFLAFFVILEVDCFTYRKWAFVSETLRQGKIKGQRSSSTDINMNIWHLPGVSRALRLNLDGDTKKDNT